MSRQIDERLREYKIVMADSSGKQTTVACLNSVDPTFAIERYIRFAYQTGKEAILRCTVGGPMLVDCLITAIYEDDCGETKAFSSKSLNVVLRKLEDEVVPFIEYDCPEGLTILVSVGTDIIYETDKLYDELFAFDRDEYRENYYDICPFCFAPSEYLNWGGTDSDCSGVSQEVSCVLCSNSWYDIFERTNVEPA